MTEKHTLGDLILKLRDFANERNWEQFHSPKNLSMALAVETAELIIVYYGIGLLQVCSGASGPHVTATQ